MKYFVLTGYSWLLLLLSLMMLAPASAQAQVPTWHMAISGSVDANNDAYVLGTTADAAGNVYVAGSFTGTARFGLTTLVSAGQEDLFVAKWSPVANGFVWAQRAGGPYSDAAAAVAVAGNAVYITGSFRSQPATFGSIALTSAGIEDLFVAKLTDAGTSSTFTWAQRVGGSLGEVGQALAVSGTNVYVAGYYNDATFGNTTLPTAAATNLFVAKLADAGPTASFVWAQSAGGSTSFNGANAVAVNGSNVYVSGFFSGTAAFGATTLTSAGSYDAVVAKLADAGPTASFVWAQRAGGPIADQAYALAVSGNAVYAAGVLGSSSASFGAIMVTGAGLNDGFVTKLVDTGPTSSFGWVQQIGGTGQEQIYALTATGGNLCVAGTFNSRPLVLGATTLTPTSVFGNDLFVARLTDAGSTGRVAWAKQASGPNSNVALSLAVAPGGILYVAGGVQPPATFDAQPISGLTGTTVATLAGLSDPTLLATMAPALWAERIGLVPNPAHGTATVQLPAGTGPATITMLDALGRAVRTQLAASSAGTSSQTALNLTGLAPGIYAVQVQAGGATATRRLLVE